MDGTAMIKKIIVGALALFPIVTFATTFSPVQLLNPAGSTAGQAILSTGASSAPAWGNISIATLTGVLPVANGGTNASTASGTSLDNITGFSGTGFLTRTGSGTYAFQSATNGITLANLAQAGANTVLGNATGSTANVATLAVPSCSTASSASNWTSGTGWGCNTSINAATLGGATFAAPGAIGGTTAGAGAFTTLGANGNDALLYQTTNALSVPSGTATTVTTWTKVSDRLNANFNATTGTFTAPVTGQYWVSANLTFAATTGGSGIVQRVAIVGNSVTLAAQSIAITASTTVAQTVTASCLVSLNAGQTIVVQAFQNSGAAVVLAVGSAYNNSLSIVRIP
jgi:hypothetical protein